MSERTGMTMCAVYSAAIAVFSAGYAIVTATATPDMLQSMEIGSKHAAVAVGVFVAIFFAVLTTKLVKTLNETPANEGTVGNAQ